MAGMTETRGDDPTDSFWTWRKLMYRFLDQLNPEQVEAIAAFGQIEMLESGYACVGEFHYLHHQPDGSPYTNIAEMSERIVAAATSSGIGLTLLPVLYHQGGCDGRALVGGQRRFGNSMDQYALLHSEACDKLSAQLSDASIGVAPHSLRAVSQSSLCDVVELAAGAPVHIHIAEQVAEVDEIVAAWQARPVEWLLNTHEVDKNWCLIHATHMTPTETANFAHTHAVAGLCPITESNLGDGIFDGVRFHAQQGRIGIGTDSNVRISLSEEMRTLEYSQRLRDRQRAVYASPGRSVGRVLFDAARQGGAQALQRPSGTLAPGEWADLLVLDKHSPALAAVSDDNWLDAWFFAADDQLVTDVWAAGRHMVREGQHIHREKIEADYLATLRALTQAL